MSQDATSFDASGTRHFYGMATIRSGGLLSGLLTTRELSGDSQVVEKNQAPLGCSYAPGVQPTRVPAVVPSGLRKDWGCRLRTSSSVSYNLCENRSRDCFLALGSCRIIGPM